MGYSWVTLNIYNCCQPISSFNLLTPFTKSQEIVVVNYLYYTLKYRKIEQPKDKIQKEQMSSKT